jgi:hypothetical protein
VRLAGDGNRIELSASGLAAGGVFTSQLQQQGRAAGGEASGSDAWAGAGDRWGGLVIHRLLLHGALLLRLDKTNWLMHGKTPGKNKTARLLAHRAVMLGGNLCLFSNKGRTTASRRRVGRRFGSRIGFGNH